MVLLLVLLLLFLLLAARASAAAWGGAIFLADILALCSPEIDFAFSFRIGFCGVF